MTMNPNLDNTFTKQLSKFNLPYKLYIGGKYSKTPYIDLYFTFYDVLDNNLENEYFIYCEDDCFLTDKFSIEKLNKLTEMKNFDAISLGSVLVKSHMNFNEELIRTGFLHGIQFLIVFKSSYQKLLNLRNRNPIFIDFLFVGFNMLCCLPFLSIQSNHESNISGIKQMEVCYASEEIRLTKNKLLNVYNPANS